MKKFIFSISDGIQVIVESNSLMEAQKEYEKIKDEVRNIKINTMKVPKKRAIKRGVYEYLLELKEEGFFSNPKTIGDIKDKLAELAIHKPITSFPPYLNNLIKERILQRKKEKINEKEVWVYENGKR
jgi:hypothetical protein